MSNQNDILKRNLENVLERIRVASEKSGRDRSAVRLIAVTKYVDADIVRSLYEVGCRDFGESRPQVLWEKANQLSDLTDLNWHMIGHLQRNKLKRTLPITQLLHSGDSIRLISAVNDFATASSPQKILLEVNTSGDSSKHGFHPNELVEQLAEISALENIDVQGLMCMASLTGGQSTAADNFSALRTLRDQIQENHSLGKLTELSMGMSGDFEVAIEEGATIVRVGSALFVE